MQQSLKLLPALMKREVLEHKNLWRVPVVLLCIAVLLKLSLSFGNLAINLDVDLPAGLQVDQHVDKVVNSAVLKALNWMNYIVMLVMFIVAFFYALSCLYDERQDDSVLFWRSLPLSDWVTVLSKMLIAVLLVPLLILVCQFLIAVVFLGIDAPQFMISSFLEAKFVLIKIVFWTLLPVVSWCIFCSSVSNRNPVLLAIFMPILFVIVDKLFLQGVISQLLVINRFKSIDEFSLVSLLIGLVFCGICIAGAIYKRTQRA